MCGVKAVSESEIVKDIIADAKSRMDKAVEAMKHDFAKVRTGRATTSLVEDIRVDYYGAPTPIKQMASVSVPEARTIVIQPWDTSTIPLIEKAIQQSELGITPMNDGKVVRVVVPELTEERRRELVRFVGKMAEEFRISVRNVRRDSFHLLKEVEKEEHLPEDVVKRAQSSIQKITDEHIEKINGLLKEKEREIMEF